MLRDFQNKKQSQYGIKVYREESTEQLFHKPKFVN